MKTFFINLGLSVLAVLAPIKGVLITTGLLVLVDCILGMLAAKKRGEAVTSAGMRRTIVKSLVYLCAVLAGYLTEVFLTKGTVPISSVISGIIGITELTSILENLNEINGKPIFNVLLKKLGSKNDNL